MTLLEPTGTEPVTTDGPDLADPSLYRDGDPAALWARLRAQSPVYRNERTGKESFWAVLGHREALEVLRRPETFVSGRGMRLDDSPGATEAASQRMLIVTDPPRHARLRQVMNAAFTPRMVARLRDTMRATATEVIDEALERGDCDFVDVAARLPVTVICDLLGVPPADRPFMLDRTMTAFGHAGPGSADRAAAARAHTDILMYYAELAERRRREPADDVVTALVQGTVDGRPLTDEEIYLNCDGLVSGGNETTRHATVGGLLALMRHPDQWEVARRADHPMETTAQEILRFTSPAMHVLRTAARDTELAGHPVRAGDRVAVWLPAANRDPAVFPDPDRFDALRTPNRHVALAPGEHYCLGAALALAELTVFFTELTSRTELPEPVGKPVRAASHLIRGFESLPVRLRPRTG
ncbi:cytochrome P450 [Streptomyces alanosinicus]|uniref:Cytochrome P450 126 n=1 Tax=Streptomyces alanosinicus TaxID=68171 RepID=A0A918YHP4_9ACTN|nr:cytochrome P450 [Streptomyces alanosinicus]GHE03394.1 putative cytochrome P450 126 [Streptomyces alanosinicus]